MNNQKLGPQLVVYRYSTILYYKSNCIKVPYIPLIGSGRLFIDRVVRRTQKASKEGLCKSLHSTAPAAKLVAAAPHMASARRVVRGVARTGGGTSSSSLDTLRRLLPQLFSDFANSIQRPFKTAVSGSS